MSRNNKSPFIYLLLFPIFFTFHGFVENHNAIPVTDILLLTVKYIIYSGLVFLLFYRLIKKIEPSAIMTLFTMAFYFFFGTLLNLIKEYAPHTFLSRYSFLLTFFSLLFIILYITLPQRINYKSTLYLNLLFCLFICSDLIILIKKVSDREKVTVFEKYDWQKTNTLPDIYILLVDEYAGNEALKTILNFDNKDFYSILSSKGFRTILNSKSNYDYTPYSTASLFNMDYLDTTKATRNFKKSYNYVVNTLNSNRFIRSLEAIGYKFYNYSIFTVAGQPPPTRNRKIPTGIQLITRNTFFARFENDVFINIALRWQIKSYLEKDLYAFKEDNDSLYDKTIRATKINAVIPRVIYTHLIMPHDPYYNDEKGNVKTYEILKKISPEDQRSYINYLKFSNKKTLALTDQILANASHPPIIILLSDHGFRHFTKNAATQEFLFSNLVSLYLPSKNYHLLNDSLTNVNLFRTVLNSEFKLNIPLLSNETHHIAVFD